jgi:hypothetical protein
VERQEPRDGWSEVVWKVFDDMVAITAFESPHGSDGLMDLAPGEDWRIGA